MKLKEIDKRETGRRIREKREQLNLTREDLGRELSVTSKFISEIEYGNKGISVETLYKLKQILNVSANYILADDEVYVDEDQRCEYLKENILGLLSVCSLEQLGCMENIVRLYVRSLVNEKEEK